MAAYLGLSDWAKTGICRSFTRVAGRAIGNLESFRPSPRRDDLRPSFVEPISTPNAFGTVTGRYRSGQTGRTVNPLAYAFSGSNPLLPSFPQRFFFPPRFGFEPPRFALDFFPPFLPRLGFFAREADFFPRVPPAFDLPRADDADDFDFGAGFFFPPFFAPPLLLDFFEPDAAFLAGAFLAARFAGFAAFFATALTAFF